MVADNFVSRTGYSFNWYTFEAVETTTIDQTTYPMNSTYEETTYQMNSTTLEPTTIPMNSNTGETTSSNNCLNQKIIGGQDIHTGDSPFDAEWIVGISMGCGGSWINQETILTAAHCFGNQPTASQQYSITKKTADGTREHIANFNGDAVTIHQAYDNNQLTHDIAVIRLCGYTEEHAIVNLPAADESFEQFSSFWVYGWGNRNPNYGGDYPDFSTGLKHRSSTLTLAKLTTT
jgi:secreted trypsin-like serine protease